MEKRRTSSAIDDYFSSGRKLPWPSIYNRQDDLYTPISSLSISSQDWRVKAKVFKKHQIRTYISKQGATSKILRIEIIDKSMTSIECVFFNKAAEKFDFIQEGHAYLFSGGEIRLSNKMYTSCPNDYQLQFDTYSSKIIEIADEEIADLQPLFRF